jgi:hypothetical protein
MTTYKLIKNIFAEITTVERNISGIICSIPFDPANTDYQNFKKEVLAGAELQDADGNVMTQAEADAFIATLP